MDKHKDMKNDEMLDGLEQDLIRAMRHVDAPEGFAARVLQRAAAQPRAKLLTMPKVRPWLGGALAAMLAIGVFAGEHIHRQHERAAQAQQEFETATRITDLTLQHAREQLARQGISLDGQ